MAVTITQAIWTIMNLYNNDLIKHIEAWNAEIRPDTIDILLNSKGIKKFSIKYLNEIFGIARWLLTELFEQYYIKNA